MAIKIPPIVRTQEALDTPFEPNRNPDYNGGASGIPTDNVQDAIEYVKGLVGAGAKYTVSAGFDGNAAVGRYLEFESNVDSNLVGFIVGVNSVLTDISIGVQTNSTCTWSVYTWNGTTETLIATISLSAARKNVVTGLNISLTTLQEIRIKLTSGSCSRPIVWLWLKTV